MPMSVRLDPETEALIRRIARQAGRSKSWVVREAVAGYAGAPVRHRTPFEALESFIGTGGTGLTDLSERTGERFTDLARIKAAGRRRTAAGRNRRER
jgi:Ribbon-helix-helix protein, copG family